VLALVLLVPAVSAQIPFEPLVVRPLLNGAFDVALVDLDEDGVLDLLTTPEPDTLGGEKVTYNVLAGLGDGTFAAPVQGAELSSHFIGRSVVADMDDDGHLDWVMPDGDPPGFVRLFPGTGGLLFGPHDFWGTTPATSGAESMVVDLDGDGHLDIVVVGFTGVFEGGTAFNALVADGLGGYTQVPGQAVPLGGYHGLAVGDLNGDGWQDVVLSNSNIFQTISIYLATSPTSWAPAVDMDGQGSGAYELELLDLDGDGLLDILAADVQGGVSVFPGLGDGSFGARLWSPAPENALRVVAGDLDGDGLHDLVVSNLGSFEIMKGAGDGTFVPVNHFTTTLPRGVDLGDLDGDGDLDVVVSLNNGLLFGPDSVAVLINHSYDAGSPFTDLGQSLAGTEGAPIQLAYGSLLPGTTYTFELYGALPGSTAFGVVGLSELNAPFKGGVLVPNPDGLLPIPVPASGQFGVGGLWPNGIAPGFSFWVQWWFDDPAAVKGKAASNAVRAVAP
jgi:hypothetical protein